MVGTSARHEAYLSSYDDYPATSDLTCEETWNMVNLGYMPVRLVLGCSIYSMGFVGGVTAALKSFVRGEISEYTKLVYEARESALQHIAKDAEDCGADDVVGIKTYVYALGSGIIEFLAIGTAVKKMPGAKTLSEQLPPQAVMSDKVTFINTAEILQGKNLNSGMRGDQH